MIEKGGTAATVGKQRGGEDDIETGDILEKICEQ